VILVWGSAADPPIADVLDELQARSVEVVHLDNSKLATFDFDVTFKTAPEGWLAVDGRRVPLDAISAIYLRPEPISDMRLQPASSCLLAVASLLDAVVVNRPAAGRSNLSKPYQLSQIADAGLSVPPTLVTTDPCKAQEFLAQHKRLVYKSISGIRSIVSTLGEQDMGRLERVATGPVQLQRWIEGIDVRVHVVGEKCFATAIESRADDYRYGDGQHVSVVATEIDDDLARSLAQLTASMGLLFAGVDLRLTPQDEWICFEINPSPGFTFYEDATGQRITAAVTDLLLSQGVYEPVETKVPATNDAGLIRSFDTGARSPPRR